MQVKGNQHAFIQGRPSVSALISTTQRWYDATDNMKSGRKGIHAIFIDFKKAFDLVNHTILLQKLSFMNITRDFWLWIQSFLTGRSQQVNICGRLSSIASCPFGVPQGSIISPILFKVHINYLEDGIPNYLNMDTFKYADHCPQYEQVGSGNNSHMQEIMDAVSNRSCNNEMIISARKTKDMWICFSELIDKPPSIHIEDEIIERVNVFKLLGIWLQDNLKWNKHIEEITRRANRKLYHLRDCRKSHLPTHVDLTIFKSIIRSTLEYASLVWGGIPKYLEDEVERVQTRCLKIIDLEKNHLPSLKERRETATRREAIRIQVNPSHPCHSLLPALADHQYNLRKNNKSSRYKLSGTERHKQSFMARACKSLLLD